MPFFFKKKIASALTLFLGKRQEDKQYIKVGDNTYLVDRNGERWDISQAVSIGFKPEHFQGGRGKDAFTPLDNSFLGYESLNVSPDLMIIGIADGSQSQAYSIPKLLQHEVSNNTIESKPILVIY